MNGSPVADSGSKKYSYQSPKSRRRGVFVRRILLVIPVHRRDVPLLDNCGTPQIC
ncbi:hypothetical protein M378DRAFT_161920, partial [Amanita muscaria Koide BX008]